MDEVVQIVITKTKSGQYHVAFMSKKETVHTCDFNTSDYTIKLLETTLPRLNYV